MSVIWHDRTRLAEASPHHPRHLPCPVWRRPAPCHGFIKGTPQLITYYRRFYAALISLPLSPKERSDLDTALLALIQTE